MAALCKALLARTTMVLLGAALTAAPSRAQQVTAGTLSPGQVSGHVFASVDTCITLPDACSNTPVHPCLGASAPHIVQIADLLGLATHQPCERCLQNVGNPVGSCAYGSLAATTFPGTKYVASAGATLPLLTGIPMNGCGACFRLVCSDTRPVRTPQLTQLCEL